MQPTTSFSTKPDGHDDGSSFGKLIEQKQEAEQKQLHLLQILDSERRAKWQYVKQTEDLAAEVRKLKLEVKFS
ncbi:unnamed protein product [Echinostoma caproni]|uniref:Uncharacterized protein n=1 Tax=Echinostoma caproni TaxID=27848 RepID=A0A183A9Z0_9TREM|nr:unnamed protein product [Echinostoma caproni]